MRKRRIGILDWESMINTISITTQENKYQDVLANDSLQSMKKAGKRTIRLCRWVKSWK